MVIFVHLEFYQVKFVGAFPKFQGDLFDKTVSRDPLIMEVLQWQCHDILIP